jgi:Na+/glutamate symporter
LKLFRQINYIEKLKYCTFLNYVPHLFLLTCVKFHGKKIDNNYTLTHICLLPFFQMALIFNTSISNYLKKFFFEIVQTNQLHWKAKILYFLNLVYFLSLVDLWQNHVLYWPLTDVMWRNRTYLNQKRLTLVYGMYPRLTISRSVIG